MGRVEEATVEGRGAEVGAIVCGEGKFIFTLIAMRHDICPLTACVFRYGHRVPSHRTHDHRPTANRCSGPSKEKRPIRRARQGNRVHPTQLQYLLSFQLTTSFCLVRVDLNSQAMEKFLQTVFQAVLRHLPFTTLKAIVVASPGFTKDAVSFRLLQSNNKKGR